jgi:uncharacterized membrane protein
VGADITKTATATDDSVIDRRIGLLLRTGMLLSAGVILVGGVLFLVRHGSTVPDYHVFHGEPWELRTLPGIFSGVAHGHARAIIQLGLLLLIATPVARVVFSVVEFALQRDFLYVTISGIVLVVLLYSLVLHGAQ